MAIRESYRHLPSTGVSRRDEENYTLTRVGGVIVWIGVPLVAWGALIWAAVQGARSML